MIVDGDGLLTALELAKADALVDHCPRHQLAQSRLSGLAEARDDLIVDGDSLLAALELAKAEALVDHCPRHLLA